MSEKEPLLPPGFRFHPTDEELIIYYLKNRASFRPCPVPIIAEVDIYKFNPWDLPDKAVFGDEEWYFFTPRDRKYPNGIRPNRAAASGYWKATGTDKPIMSSSSSGRRVGVGVKKALVFYRGKPPKGSKTNWIMHEYRLVNGLSGCSRTFNDDNGPCLRPLKGRDSDSSSMRLDDWVLCRIYEKKNQAKLDTEEEGSTTNVTDDHFHLPISSNTNQENIITRSLPKISSLTDIFQDSNSDICRLIYGNPQQVLTSNLAQDNIIMNQTCNPQQVLTSNLAQDNIIRNQTCNISVDPRLGCLPLLDRGVSTVNGGSGGVQNQETECMINGNISSRSFRNNQYFNTSNHGFHDQNNLLWRNNSHYLE